MKIPKIHYEDRCKHCGRSPRDNERPCIIFSKARAQWLEHAAHQLATQYEGDDEWADWMDEGERLSKAGE